MISKTHLVEIQNFVLSKLIHNKAVEVLIYGFPQDIKLLLHFKDIYKKHYSKINIIPEVKEPSESDKNQSHKNYDSNEDNADKSFKEEIQSLKNKIQMKMKNKKL